MCATTLVLTQTGASLPSHRHPCRQNLHSLSADRGNWETSGQAANHKPDTIRPNHTQSDRNKMCNLWKQSVSLLSSYISNSCFLFANSEKWLYLIDVQEACFHLTLTLFIFDSSWFLKNVIFVQTPLFDKKLIYLCARICLHINTHAFTTIYIFTYSYIIFCNLAYLSFAYEEKYFKTTTSHFHMVNTWDYFNCTK